MNFYIIRYVDIYIGIPLVYIFFFLKKLLSHTDNSGFDNKYNKILLVKFWGVGNISLILPAAYSIKERYPAAEIDFLTFTPNSELLKISNMFSNVYTIDIKNYIRFTITAFKTLILLRKNNYDVIIDFELFARFSAFYCSLIRSKRRIGFNTRDQHRHLLYDYYIRYHGNAHITRLFSDLTKYVIREEDEGTKVPIILERSESNFIHDFLYNKNISSEKDIIILMHLGTSKNFIARR